MLKQNLEKRQIDLIEESLKVFEMFQRLKNLHKRRELTFSDVAQFVDDRGKSSLFRLKEMCHELYRNSDFASHREKLYDITVGYIFHEAMKLRENLYQLEYYKPRTLMFKESLNEKERKIIKEMDSLITKAERRMKEGLFELRRLFKDLMDQLVDLINLYRDNYLLPRFLYEKQKNLVSVFGRNGFLNILSGVGIGDKTDLMFLSGVSYLAGDHYDEARSVLKKLWAKRKNDLKVVFFYNFSNAFFYFLKGKLREAQRYAQNALEIGKKLKASRGYLERLESLLLDLKKEEKGRR